MALPTITITTETVAQPPSVRIDEVVGVVGPVGTGGTGVAGTLYHANTLQGTGNVLSAALGSDGDTRRIISDLLSQVTVEIIFSPVVVTAGTTTETLWDAAVDLLKGADPKVTTILVARDYTQAENGVGAGGGVAELARISGELNARAVVSGPQDSAANFITWMNANSGPNVMGIFNGPVDVPPSGLWLGAALRVAAVNREGRGHGIQLAVVSGAGTLQHTLNLGLSTLTNIDNANGSSIILHNGRHRIAGGEFNYASQTELQRDWAIARVVDHAKNLITNRWDGLSGSPKSLPVLATRLEESLAPIVGTEIVRGTVTGVGGTGGNKIFNLDLDIIHPVNSMEVHIRINEVVGT